MKAGTITLISKEIKGLAYFIVVQSVSVLTSSILWVNHLSVLQLVIGRVVVSISRYAS